MTRSIQCIRGEVSHTDAERLVASASGQAVRMERALYYPYLWYRLHYSLATLFGRPRFEVDCLVDGRQGRASTSDAFETLHLSPPATDVLELSVDPDSGALAARRTMSHVLAKKYRTMTPLKLGVGPSQVLYKKFWVVECGAAGPNVLVDSTTGRFVALTGTREAA